MVDSAQSTDASTRGFTALRVERGDRGGVWSTNDVEWVVARIATAEIRAILASANLRIAPSTVGRGKDMLIGGGENVYLREIERFV